MTQPSTRRLLAAALTAAALVLAACAPPGQEGRPGVAAVYDGRTITNVELEQILQAWVLGTDGTVVPRRDQILTIELVRERALAEVRELGYALTDDDAALHAERWLQFNGITAEPTPELISAVQGLYAVAALVVLDPELTVLYDIALDVEESVVLSPRSGTFSADAFMQSVAAAASVARARNLGTMFYVEFQGVTGLDRVDTPWIDNG